MGRYGPAGAMSPAVQQLALAIADGDRAAITASCSYGTIEVQPAWYSTMEFQVAHKISTAEADTSKQVLQRRHDADSGADETTDGLDATKHCDTPWLVFLRA